MLVQGLGWGLVETVINPLTSALYPEDRVGRLSASCMPGIRRGWWRRADGPGDRSRRPALALEHDPAGACCALVFGVMATAGKTAACQRLHRRAGDAGRDDQGHLAEPHHLHLGGADDVHRLDRIRARANGWMWR